MPKAKRAEIEAALADEEAMDEAAVDEGMADEEMMGTAPIEEEGTMAPDEATIGPESIKPPILVSVEEVPEFRDLAIGDQATITLETINDDGTVGFSVFETLPASKAVGPEAAGGMSGRAAVEAALA